MPTTQTYGGTPGFTVNPAPQAGAGTFGAVPGPIGMPDPYGNLSAVFPNLSRTNTATSSALLNQLRGVVSPETQMAIKDAAAAWGVQGGAGAGSGIAGNLSLRNLGLTSEQLQQQGLQNYSSILPTVASTQTVQPALQAEISAQNALNAAAPNPTAAASYAEQLFNNYMAMMQGPAGGAPARGGPWDMIRQGGPAAFGAGAGFTPPSMWPVQT